jgi:hypothetical protein
MRRLLVVAALALVLPAAAHAKGPFQVCGASGCVLLGEETHPPVRIIGVDPSTPAVAPARPAPYFVIRFSDFSEPLAYWIPSASALRLVSQNATGQWVATLPAEDSLLRDKAAALKPFAAPTRVSAFVDYEPVKRSNGYLRLFTIGAQAATTPSTRWLEVWVRGPQSPWTDGTTLFWISRRGSFLKREGTVFEIPATVAKRIRARLPLG